MISSEASAAVSNWSRSYSMSEYGHFYKDSEGLSVRILNIDHTRTQIALLY